VPEASALDERTGIYGIPSRHHGIAPEVHGLFTGQSQFYCGERATKRDGDASRPRKPVPSP
jgi:hypothetical protein